MDKPTLTPHADALEKALPAMLAVLSEARKHPMANQRMIEMTLAITPPMLCEIAKCRDADVDLNEMLQAFTGAVTNLTMSVIGSVIGRARADDPVFISALETFIANLCECLQENVNEAGSDTDRRFTSLHQYRPGATGRA
jgi:hypothetical protein